MKMCHFNREFHKTLHGLTKLVEMVIGSFCLVCLLAADFPLAASFFCLMLYALFLTTSCLVVTGLLTLDWTHLYSAMLFEFIYHSVGFIFLLISSIVFVYNFDTNMGDGIKVIYTIAATLSAVNSFLYGLSAFFALRQARKLWTPNKKQTSVEIDDIETSV